MCCQRDCQKPDWEPGDPFYTCPECRDHSSVIPIPRVDPRLTLMASADYYYDPPNYIVDGLVMVGFLLLGLVSLLTMPLWGPFWIIGYIGNKLDWI